MAEPLADQVIEMLGQARELYHRLVLLVGPAGAGKTAALQGVRARLDVPSLSVNLQLSLRLLDLAERQRTLHIHELLTEIVDVANAEATLLDNIEILFDVKLKQDPLRLLQGLSRNRTMVAAWNGEAARGRLTYAVPGHPEFRQYPTDELLIVSARSA